MRSNIRRASSKKRILILSLLVLLLCLSIGYAALSQSLKLNTVANVDKMTWDVHLENIVVRNGSVSAIPPVISSDKTSVSLTVTFREPNEYYEYYVDVVNNGSINAQVESLSKTSLSTEQAKFIDYKITYKDETEIKRNDILASGEKETLKVLVYIKDLHPSLYPTINETLTLEGKINYIQKNDDGVTRNKNSLYEEIKKQTQLDTGINFGVISSDTNGKGVYTLSRTTSYAYPIYYYRGEVYNNNVIFANFCWKIIRTTTTGGIKLIYNGIPNNGICNNTGNATEIGRSAFNTEGNDSEYVGYMYDNNAKDSAVKEVIDTWFASSLLNHMSDLEDTPFYNERDYVLSSTNQKVFAAMSRIWGSNGNYDEAILNTTTRLGATNKEDIFTVNSDNGNGKLTYPVGMITSDEVVLAGGRGWINNENPGMNTSYYLWTGIWYWTLSPCIVSSNTAFVLDFHTIGSIHTSRTIGVAGVRPVVSLVSEVTYTRGDGTSNNPYVL